MENLVKYTVTTNAKETNQYPRESFSWLWRVKVEYNYLSGSNQHPQTLVTVERPTEIWHKQIDMKIKVI